MLSSDLSFAFMPCKRPQPLTLQTIMCNQLNWIVFWYEAFICVSLASKRDTNNIHWKSTAHEPHGSGSFIFSLLWRLDGMSVCPKPNFNQKWKQHKTRHGIEVKTQRAWRDVDCCYGPDTLVLSLKLHFLFDFSLKFLFFTLFRSIVLILKLFRFFFIFWVCFFSQCISRPLLLPLHVSLAILRSIRRDDCPLFINAICIGASMPTTCTSNDWFSLLHFFPTHIYLTSFYLCRTKC